MEKVIDLKGLLLLEMMELYSAEEQTLQALPEIIQKAKDGFLKTALKEHLDTTRKQVSRLNQAKKLLVEAAEDSAMAETLSGLFAETNGKRTSRGIAGLIEESEKMMEEPLSPEVLDAAIIGCAQKIEHYEICAYGTAAAHARELGLVAVASLLEETLAEEYEADERLNDLALGGLNEEAEAESPEDDEWMHSGRPTSAELGKAPSPAKSKKEETAKGSKSGSKSPKKQNTPAKSEPAGKAPAKAKKSGIGVNAKGTSSAKGKRPSANVKSPGGRAGTSHRERRSH